MAKKIVSFAISEKTAEKIGKISKALGMKSRGELVEFSVNRQFPDETISDINKIARLQEEAAKERMVK